jgi:hypothetical protein
VTQHGHSLSTAACRDRRQKSPPVRARLRLAGVEKGAFRRTMELFSEIGFALGRTPKLVSVDDYFAE